MDGGRARGQAGMSRSSRSSSRSRQRSFAAEAPVRTTPKGFDTKIGEGGIPVRLYSNHFTLETPKDVIIYDYHISFVPIVEDLKLRSRLIYQQRELFNSCYIFDGGANVKSLHQILDTLTVSGVNYVNEPVEITIKPTGRITWGHPEMMRFYNTQMRRNLTHIGMTEIGRNFFDKSGSIPIPEHAVEVWPGMLTAINEHDAGIMLVANSLHKIIRKETAHDMLKRLYSNCKREYFIDSARRELAGAIVMTKYNSKLIESMISFLGVRMTCPKFFWLDDDRIQTYLTACRSVPPNARLVHLIVPNNNRDRYSAIKRFFCCEQPCPSQILTNRVLKKNQLAIVSKLLFQMSCKMGAQAWALIIPPKNTMVVGYNTYKDTSRGDRIVGAFVCSTNSEITTWYSRVAYHASYDELSSNFAASLKSGLKAWYSANQRWPDKLIIYRDGVSEGQVGLVYHNETRKVDELLKEREDLSDTTWSFVIVNKRVNARFFAKFAVSEPVTNPIPGTIIDSVVTRKERFDFYLVSQCVRAGTVNPTMYNIIYDNTKWKPVHHQFLTYKLCHLYYNWAGTISVPAPCQYAYKLACLVGTSVHQPPSPALANQLYFL